MKPNPLSDVLHFLVQPSWTTGVYWLWVLASIAIAIYAWTTIDSQRSLRNLGDWICRFLIGSMWWQQSLWKLPLFPSDPTTSGLYYWLTQMAKSTPIPLQANFVKQVVLPHFYSFAPIVYGLEVLTGVSLILGLCVRFWGVIGALQVLNLWLGLYNAEGEWPWTYFFLLVLQSIFAVHQYGRSLGLDAIIVERARRHSSGGALSRLVLGALT